MFVNEAKVISETYEKKSGESPTAEALSNRSCLASLLFKMLIYSADYYPEHRLGELYAATRAAHEDWLMAANALCGELIK